VIHGALMRDHGNCNALFYKELSKLKCLDSLSAGVDSDMLCDQDDMGGEPNHDQSELLL
jgi:hypothetical protein